MRRSETPTRPKPFSGFADELYVMIVAGIATGVVVVGVGSRLAMLILRLTSPGQVVGMQSDDDFTIGRFTLSGTYNLLLIGAGVGVIGACAYQWVRPWLLGPRWFRLLTLALGSGAVVGSMLVHADGIDFRVLKPMWLAVTLFVALPAAFAVSIAVAVDAVEARAARGRTRRSWLVPIVLTVMFPPLILLVAVASAVLLIWVGLRDTQALRRLAASGVVATTARVLWFGVAAAGLVALVGDVADLRALA